MAFIPESSWNYASEKTQLNVSMQTYAEKSVMGTQAFIPF